ncbi:HEAT repeat domain-containing protein [Paenibacillus arenosi]|uniref:HEAT repeat domain-containing protein n=1 Tax=Paenibacillus arenosi TaxID=2774142 RepID=A0ABR9AWF6_9BACL|nr:HEAT repeat domain-containing protein [Paenibacillus arenosi]MBD8498435.1 HEAT repeat domain-containing protein [Paenibacillus arenosi]
MSTALLQELHQEVRRIYIAGSDLATGDFRLKRMLPQFEQLGERAPVFKKLAEGIAAVIAPESQETRTSAEKLQDLGLLLSSVLRTLGTTSVEGELRDTANLPHSLTTNLSFRKLAAVKEALTTTGSGRYEIVREAFEAKMFDDMRLLPHAIAALNDPYSELADLVEKKILPSYGPQIVPHLIATYDASGGRLHARKLHVIAVAGGADMNELVLEAAQSGSDEVKVSAIERLADYEQYEPVLLELSRERKKTVREATYYALAKRGSSPAITRLYEAFSGKDMDNALEAACKCDNADFTAMLVNGLELELKQASVVMEDKKKREALWSRIYNFLKALLYRQSDEIYTLLEDVITRYECYVQFGWTDLFDYAADYMEKCGTKSAMYKLYELERRDNRYLPQAFRCSHRLLSPSQLYDRYVEFVDVDVKPRSKKELEKYQKALVEAIESIVVTREYNTHSVPWMKSGSELWISSIVMIPAEQISDEWDDRWLDWFIERRAFDLVCAFARPGHAAAEEFLTGLLVKPLKQSYEFAEKMVRGLLRMKVDDHVRWEALMTLMETTRCDVIDVEVMEQLHQLPATYYERLVAVFPKHRHSSLELLEYVADRMKTDANLEEKA